MNKEKLAKMPGVMRPGEGNDTVCDCTFQDVREYKNPFYGKTLRYRFCCLLKNLQAKWPELFEELDAFFDDATGEVVTQPRPWDGDRPMPDHMARVKKV